MGQFLNQPDFIEFGNVVVPSNTINASTNLNKASLWVGGTGTVKAILSSTLGGVVTDLTITSPGVGYATATGVATLNDDGTVASGLTVDITVDGTGGVATAALNSAGSGYTVGQTLRLAGGTSMAVITVTGVNNTPLASQAVSFQGVQAGTYLPVIVDYVLIESTSPASLMVSCH
mgnify:FL=1|tara:strand:- start:1600 stop:2124 length:525 start_codon:yes stop_codon:yes gene_type:complete